MIEKDVETHLVKKVEKNKGWCPKWVAPGNTGVPDRLVIINGQTYYVELKSPTGRLRPKQRYIHQKLKDLGHEVYVLSTKEEVDQFVKDVVKP